MKDSGIEWLGKIPEEWKVKKLKYISSIKFSNVDKHTTKGELQVRLCNYVDVYYNDYITSSLDFMKATASTAEITKFTLKEGDIIITKDSESWDDIAIPAYVPLGLEGVICGYHLAQIRPNSEIINGEFLFRSFCANTINDQFKIAATGVTRFGLGKYWLDNSIFIVPPIKEQKFIASYLDQETAKIDTLIEKKERQIELLKEKRSALISHAVTKGLDPNAQMKDSGIEWLGNIPEHWEVKRLKYMSSVNGEVLEESTPDNYEIEYVDIGSVDRYEGIVKTEILKFEDAPSRARRKVRNGDIIVSTVRTYLRAITSIINPTENLIVSTGFAVIRPGKLFNPKFANYALRATYFIDTVVANSVGVSYPAINASDLVSIKIPLPPLKEQLAIAIFIDRKITKTYILMSKIQESIEKLREYRTALISAAVTGKINLNDE